MADSSPQNNDMFSPILTLMNSYAQQLRFDHDKKDFILVLGNTGAGKSTLTSLLTDAELQSIETEPGLCEYIIADDKGLISGQSPIMSKTIIPELMIDIKNHINYYDCPGFNDSRSVANDISVTYLIQQLIKHANRLKLVFAVNYSSVRTGMVDRRDFMEFTKHAISFVKHFEKYRDAIALIVTKVDSRCIDDLTVIGAIANFLQIAKKDLKTKKCSNDEEQEFNNKKIRFIEILLHTNEHGEFDRIGIMRLANESGPINQIQFIQYEKCKIESIIGQNIQFVLRDLTDFGYTISDESRNNIHQRMQPMRTHLTEDVIKIGKEIHQFYLQQEQFISDLKTLKELFSKGHRKLLQIQSNEPKTFVQDVVAASNYLEIGISFDISKQTWQHLECIEFIKMVCDSNVWSLLDISTGLNSTVQYIENGQKWYNFLINLHDELSKHTVHSQPKIHEICEELITKITVDKNTEKDINELGLKTFLKDIDSNLYSAIERLQVNSFKAKALRTVLSETIRHPSTEPTADTLIVKGYNVKISDVIEKCQNTTKYIKIFALNNMFIDMDFNGIGEKLQLSIIAPNWRIIDQKQIDLSGADGQPHSERTGDGEFDAFGEGVNGKAGNPGGASGHFMAIGQQFFNAENLTIHVNGGNGGPGQNGGKGRDGVEGQEADCTGFRLWGTPFRSKDGSNALESRSSMGLSSIPPFFTVEYDVKEKEGSKPGKGGDGGYGGIGGKPGSSIIVALKDPHVKFSIRNC